MLKIKTVTCQIGFEEILFVSWLDYDPAMKQSFETYFFNVIELVSRANIRKLVLDCSCRKTDSSEQDFQEINELFINGLSATGLEKMARIYPVYSGSNLKFNGAIKKLKDELNMGFELMNFTDHNSALAWLKEDTFHYRYNPQKYA